MNKETLKQTENLYEFKKWLDHRVEKGTQKSVWESHPLYTESMEPLDSIYKERNHKAYVFLQQAMNLE